MTKYFFSLILISTFACATGEKQAKDEPSNEAEVKEVDMSDPEMETQIVLNPNLATKEQLLSIPQIDEEKAERIISNRPYVESKAFVSLLREFFPEEVVSDVSASLFLPINLNTAEGTVFMDVPGVGEKMAGEFEEYRPYKSIEQFRREIGKYARESEVARFEQYVFVPVNLNEASKEEILSIPGMGDKMLQEFEEYRPYKSIEQFRREIGKYVDDEELARLERYVTLE
ncbi:MAG: helix-hairpin-helix domain-containing protein [Bacteroidota bacterium]